MDKVQANFIVSVCLTEGLPLQLSKFVACQSCFETANWTNRNYNLNKNGFGYKRFKGSKHQLLGKGITSTEGDSYAAYATFSDSIKEVCDWIKRRQKEGKFPRDLTTIQKPEQYAFLLKSCGYYGGPQTDYAKGVAMYFEKLNNDIA
jgi:hypothetical protein